MTETYFFPLQIFFHMRIALHRNQMKFCEIWRKNESSTLLSENLRMSWKRTNERRKLLMTPVALKSAIKAVYILRIKIKYEITPKIIHNSIIQPISPLIRTFKEKIFSTKYPNLHNQDQNTKSMHLGISFYENASICGAMHLDISFQTCISKWDRKSSKKLFKRIEKPTSNKNRQNFQRNPEVKSSTQHKEKKIGEKTYKI